MSDDLFAFQTIFSIPLKPGLNRAMTEWPNRRSLLSRPGQATTQEKRLPRDHGPTALEPRLSNKVASALDMETASGGSPSAILDRLKLDDKRIAAMAKGLREVRRSRPRGKNPGTRTRPKDETSENNNANWRYCIITNASKCYGDDARLCFKSGNAAICAAAKKL